MTHDFLLEIGTEDLPARFVMPLAQALHDGMLAGFAQRGVAHGPAQLFATPRRLALLVSGVALQQSPQTLEFSGPALAVALKDGQPTPAALGFAKKCGVDFAALGQKDGKLHYSRSQPGQLTSTLIPALFEETLKGMDALVPKRMRWGEGGCVATIGRQPIERRAMDGVAGGSGTAQGLATDGLPNVYRGDETFVRPVLWLLCLLGRDVVPLERFGLNSWRTTYGHRFHAPAAIDIAQPADYEAALKAAKVWADVDSRKADIRRQIEAKATALGGVARITEDLLDEVTALVEWPVVIAGQMEARFTDELPPEVIVATVETNQRYFTVFADASLQKLTPYFITIANIESKDPAQVVEGNERVVRPRLTDALFFWQQDQKQPLEAYGEKLKTATYQKELGSQYDRVTRLTKLSQFVGQALEMDIGDIQHAATLCKCDLNTKMVFEFPELQGLMGGYYATKCGKSPAVAKAIREHYLPTQQGTPIPSSQEGQVLALADKLDALAGIFAIGQKPTASKDPFALRRAANGVLRICVEGGLELNLASVLREALKLQPTGKKDEATAQELLDFVLERLRAYAEGQGATVEQFEAVKALGITQPLDFMQRLVALRAFVALPEAANLAAAHKRVRNILKQAGGRTGAVNTDAFEHDAEPALFAAMQTVQAANQAQPDYTQQLLALATLRDAVYAFMDARTATGEPLKVMADNPVVRANRVNLLAELDQLCRTVADISLLPG